MSELLNVSTETDQPSARHFSRLFIITLVIVALLLTVGEVVTQLITQHQVDRVMVIRVAAMQRHQSQQIVNKALQLSSSANSPRFYSILSELQQIYAVFETNHRYVEQGRIPGQDIVISNSDSVQYRYRQVRPYFDFFRQSTTHLIRKARQAGSARNLHADEELAVLLANERPFLEKMDAVIQQYNRENIYYLNTLQKLEIFIYLFTITVLALIGWFVLRPAVSKFQEVISQLVEAENRTATTNRKLLSLNRTLKETRQQLFDATRQQYQQQMDEQKMRTSYLVAGQEEERKRLSRELHDGIGQMLTAIKLQVESLEKSLNGPAKEVKNLAVLKTLIAQTIQETRNVSNNLMPTVLSDFGLIPAVKMLADTHDKNSPIEVSFHTNLSNVRLDKSVEIGLYRIAQEAVSNAIRHAEPHQITIDLFEKDDYLHLIVNDDGKGFRIHRSRKEENKRPSQGIHNMHERAALINGKFKISSAPDKGTKVQVSIPFKLAYQEYEYTQTNAGR
ncbi:sensor histidine kinase [Larkinella soli]|uniref:sensor histidine kinase n=1 Tax=Larkinella soli TaxID=1770527 RepID=UPI001E4284D6|nr:sensor histidine kinase [Larkinella soli]